MELSVIVIVILHKRSTACLRKALEEIQTAYLGSGEVYSST